MTDLRRIRVILETAGKIIAGRRSPELAQSLESPVF